MYIAGKSLEQKTTSSWWSGREMPVLEMKVQVKTLAQTHIGMYLCLGHNQASYGRM